MVGAVIVALPSVDDKVSRISSEKVPHLTLAFLGDAANIPDLDEIVLYVQHAASHLSPFGLTVDYRGKLGSEDADVVFFEESSWDMPRIRQFRHHLLLNDSIRRAFDSVEQFPKWTPHVTLGYPDTPANEDDSEYPGIHHVQFDRIAVWTGDYDGPEFRLKYEDETTLAHFGVKGMRWGHRKDKPPAPTYSPTVDPVALGSPIKKMDATIHTKTQDAAYQVSALLKERYGYEVGEVIAIPDERKYKNYIAYVWSDPTDTRGQINVQPRDMTDEMKKLEDSGWFGEGCGNIRSVMTHETAHSMFHAEQSLVKTGFLKREVQGGERHAREVALKEALAAAAKDGIKARNFGKNISGYANYSLWQEETEAELFSRYHWSENNPRFINVWGKALHRELGLDPTPFRKVVNDG